MKTDKTITRKQYIENIIRSHPYGINPEAKERGISINQVMGIMVSDGEKNVTYNTVSSAVRELKEGLSYRFNGFTKFWFFPETVERKEDLYEFNIRDAFKGRGLPLIKTK